MEPCDICQSVDELTPSLEAGLAGVGPVWIHRCDACGFHQVRPRLTTGDLAVLYGGDYFDASGPHGFRGYARQRMRYERDAFFLAKELRALGASGRLLEVGSALGFLLGALTRRTDWEVEGVEVSAFGAWYARDRFGVTVHQTTLEQAELPSDRFDYVLQKDLLEHVLHPRRHLEETRRLMRLGGRLRLVTPNGEADLRPLRAVQGRSDAVPVLAQGHLSFFSRAQLLRLFAETGFRVLRFRNIGIRRGVRALGLVPGWRHRPPLVARAELSRFAPTEGAPAANDDDHETRAAGIDAEVARYDGPWRRWRPYYYYRHLMKRLDTLPPGLTLGQDYDILLEKIG